MRALHSSSALAANFFDYWTDRDKTPLLSALGINTEAGCALDFEAQFDTGLRGTPPHLDVAITCSTGLVIAVEAKFTEHLRPSIRGKSDFKPSYFPESRDLWSSNGLYACQEFAEELRDGRRQFEHLDPQQLVKHALGLATQLDNGFRLYYLYYDWPGARSEVHEREIHAFDERVGNEIRFKALTYQAVFEHLSDSGQADCGYLDYLKARYFTRRA